jgi:hypothetical protein
MPTKDKDMVPPRSPEAEILPARTTGTNNGISSQRRKLIKASAAAVPAIMTLRSGSAAAAAAASLHGCIESDKQAALALTADDKVLGDQAGELDHDGWARLNGVQIVWLKTVQGLNGVENIYYSIRNQPGDDSPSNFLHFEYDATIDTYVQVNSGIVTSFIAPNWNSPDRLTIYCVRNVSGWECVLDNGGQVPAGILSPTAASTLKLIDQGLLVGMLVYIATDNGEILGHTYYPKIAMTMDQQAFPMGVSCLCSVDPNYNLMG